MIYYKIADKVIGVRGESARDVEKLPNFKPFKCEDSAECTEAFPIELNSNYDDFAEDGLLYSLQSEGVSYRFSTLDKGTAYGFKVEDSTRDCRLSLIYNEKGAVIGGDTHDYSIVFMMWVAYGLAFVADGVVAVHSSNIVVDQKAVIFLGESGTGKSTHTRLWRENIEGATLLNDDSPILRVMDGVVYAYGSPWSGKTPCYKNERYELAGIVRLSQAPENKMRRLSVLESFSALYPSCPPAFAGSETLSGEICTTISAILSQVPVWHLSCLPDGDAAQLSYQTVLGE